MRSVVPVLALALASLGLVACAPAEDDAADDTASAAALTPAYAKWSAFADAHGVRATAGRARVVGIRGRDTTGRAHATTVERGVFDDSLVVLTADGRAVPLAVSTHPWERGSTSSPDVDGDGKGDVGMLAPGRYLAIARSADRNIAGLPTWHVLNPSGVDGLAGARNTDHDGVYSEREVAASKSRGDRLTAILFHKGGAGAPAAIGCQVLDADGVAQLAKLVGGRDRFDYLLVDASVEADLPDLPE